MINTISYKIDKNESCITPCPFGEKFDEEDFQLMRSLVKSSFPKLKFDNVIYVGSGFCQECEYFVSLNDEKKFVMCKHYK